MADNVATAVEPVNISKLYRHLEVLELGVTACRGEVSQVIEQQSGIRTEMETRQQNLKERLMALVAEREEKEESIKNNLLIMEVDKRLKKVETEGKEDTARTDSLVKTTEKLAAKHDIMAEKGDIVDLIKMSRTTSKSLEELSSRVDATESFVKSSVPYREREENKKRELEDRILALESNRSRDTDHIMKKVDEVESLFLQVCVIVDQKVTPLRRLLRILNDLHMPVEKREQLLLRLDEVTKQVAVTSGKVSNLETTKQQVPVGFIAQLNTATPVKINTVITDFKHVGCNEGGHYDPTTGMFVAPRDGIYVASVSHQQLEDGELEVCVCHKDVSGAWKRAVCCSVTVINYTNGCGVGLVKMNQGEKLYVHACLIGGDVEMMNISSFSCFSFG